MTEAEFFDTFEEAKQFASDMLEDGTWTVHLPTELNGGWVVYLSPK